MLLPFRIFRLDFTMPESVLSGIIMLAVTVMTGTLTAKLKAQERLRAESEREKMRANLLRAVSHDLRTPLTSIYGSCSAIIENYDRLSPERQRKLLGEIREDAEWLIQMVENLLSVTRIGGGEGQYHQDAHRTGGADRRRAGKVSEALSGSARGSGHSG